MSLRSERGAAFATAVALVAVGCFAWWLSLSPALRVDASRLALLPTELGAWRSTDIPMDAAVESMLRADFNLQRAYVHPLGEVIWLYVGYYGTSRGGSPEHVPRACYQAHGWRIEAQLELETGPQMGLRAQEYVVERDGVYQLVHFWYRSHRETGIVSVFGLALDHLIGRFWGRRADGALVRVSTPIEDPENLVVARGRLAGFGAALDPLLEERWPTEAPIRAEAR